MRVRRAARADRSETEHQRGHKIRSQLLGDDRCATAFQCCTSSLKRPPGVYVSVCVPGPCVGRPFRPLKLLPRAEAGHSQEGQAPAQSGGFSGCTWVSGPLPSVLAPFSSLACKTHWFLRNCHVPVLAVWPPRCQNSCLLSRRRVCIPPSHCRPVSLTVRCVQASTFQSVRRPFYRAGAALPCPFSVLGCRRANMLNRERTPEPLTYTWAQGLLASFASLALSLCVARTS